MGETLGTGVGYGRGSSNGKLYGIGYGELGISILRESLDTGGGRYIGSSGG